MSPWTRVRLGDVARVVGGTTPSSTEQANWGGDVVWITPTDLGRLAEPTILGSERRISEEARRRSGIDLIPPGAVVMSSRAPIGHLGIAGTWLTTNQGCKSFVPGSSIDSEFLFLALRAAMPEIKRLGAGATFAEVSKSTLERFEILIPPLDEQRRVAGRLTSQLAAASQARAAQLVSRETISGLVRAQLNLALEPAPDWIGTTLGRVVEIQLGKMLSPAAKKGRRPIPYIRNANVQWDRFWLDDVAEMDFDEREEAKFVLRPGDVLVCEGGEPGRAAVWDGQIERCCYQKALHRLRAINDAVDPRFLMYVLWLGALRGEFTDDHAKTTIAHLPAVRLATLRVALPRVGEQRRIAARIRERMAAIELTRVLLRSELEAIEAVPAALLRRMFAEHQAA